MTEETRSNEDNPTYGLVGEAEALRGVRETISKLDSDLSPVLITGESGVGKELVARAVHAVSPLANQVYIPVDSAALVGTLMESELFGHVKGAFTGASENKQGLVRAADGGTLFFDEVGELSPEIQAKLLRLLQEGEVRPVGAAHPIRVNVRIISATNRDLRAAVRNGSFRKDLYYRLNVISIRIPPLRERRGDIPALIQHFCGKYSATPVGFSDEVLSVMKRYHWPGNVWELENAVRHMVALKANPVAGLEDLPSGLRNFAQSQRTFPDDEILPLAEIERQHILKAVRYAKGDMNMASSLLGIGRTTLYRKVKAYRQQEAQEEAGVMAAARPIAV